MPTQPLPSIAIIVAAATNHTIGKDNQLLWHLPQDLLFFKNKTWGMPIIMGRKTFDSIGKPLKGRVNIVVTQQTSWQQEGVLVASSIPEALRIAAQQDYKEVLVIGGGRIYEQTLPLANIVYLTRVHAVIEGDTFFPPLDTTVWQKKSTQRITADAKHAHDFSFETWVKK